MKEYLERQKRNGTLDFIEIDLDWGRNNKEFLIFSLENNKFSRIFYDNKYREEYHEPKKLLSYIEDIQKKYEDGLDDRGIYNTRESYNKLQKQLDFVRKYI